MLLAQHPPHGLKSLATLHAVGVDGDDRKPIDLVADVNFLVADDRHVLIFSF